MNTNSSTVVADIGANATMGVAQEEIESVPISRIAPAVSESDNLGAFLTHPLKLYHATLTAASSTSILSTNIIADYITAATPLSIGKKLANFNFLSSEIELDVVVQGQPFAAGQWVLGARPYCRPSNIMTASKVTNLHLVNAKILPHVVIDPSKTCSYKLRLPCLNHIGVYNLKNTNYGSYELVLYEFNPLKSGTAVTATMSVCVYMSFANVAAVGTTLLSGSFSKEKTPASTIVKAVSRATNLLIPILGPEVGLFSALGEAAGNVMAWFGYSKPPITETQVLALTRIADNYSQYDGRSVAVVLAGETTNSVGLSPSYGGAKRDDMSIAAIAAKKGLIYQGTVTLAMASESDILGFGIPVCPNIAFQAVAANYDLSPLGGVALPFGVWAGDITITVEIVASIFHRASILIAWDPNGGATPAFVDALSTLQNVTVAVSGNSETTITIPWKQPEPYKHIYPPAIASFAVPLANTNGNLYMYLINPVTCNGSTDGFDFNVYVHSDNIFFAAPQHSRVNAWSSSVVTLLSGDFAPLTVSFGARTNLDSAERRSFGESYVSVKQLTSKLGPALKDDGLAQDTIAGTNPYYRFRVPNLPLFNTGTTADWGFGFAYVSNNMFGWFSQAYVGYRGSIRWSFISGVPLVTVSNGLAYEGKRWIGHHSLTSMLGHSSAWSLVGNAEYSDLLSSYAFSVLNMSFVKSLDFVAPTLINAEFIPTAITSTANMNKVEALVERVIPSGATNPITNKFMWLNGSGDDGSFVFFQGFPRVTAFVDPYV